MNRRRLGLAIGKRFPRWRGHTVFDNPTMTKPTSVEGESGMSERPSDPMQAFHLPDRIAVDADGFGWRVWDDEEHWSMVPVNPDNSPIPQPVTFYVPEARLSRLEEALERIARGEEEAPVGMSNPAAIARTALSRKEPEMAEQEVQEQDSTEKRLTWLERQVESILSWGAPHAHPTDDAALQFGKQLVQIEDKLQPEAVEEWITRMKVSGYAAGNVRNFAAYLRENDGVDPTQGLMDPDNHVDPPGHDRHHALSNKGETEG